MKEKYIVKVNGNLYIGKGFYKYQGEKYKVLVSSSQARRFSSYEQSKRETEKMIESYVNIDARYTVIRVME